MLADAIDLAMAGRSGKSAGLKHHDIIFSVHVPCVMCMHASLCALAPSVCMCACDRSATRQTACVYVIRGEENSQAEASDWTPGRGMGLWVDARQEMTAHGHAAGWSDTLGQTLTTDPQTPWTAWSAERAEVER